MREGKGGGGGGETDDWEYGEGEERVTKIGNK